LKTRCNAVAGSTGQPCKRRAMPGSRYCCFHVERIPLILGGIVGAILSLVATELWRTIVPSEESRRLSAVESKLDPFVQMAKERFPTLDTEAALNKLQGELEEIRRLAAPPEIFIDAHTAKMLDNGYFILIHLKASKNVPLGTVRFRAALPDATSAKILEFKPAIMMAMNVRTSISSDGRVADLQFAIPGSEGPSLKLLVSDPSRVRIEGSHGFRPVVINAE